MRKIRIVSFLLLFSFIALPQVILAQSAKSSETVLNELKRQISQMKTSEVLFDFVARSSDGAILLEQSGAFVAQDDSFVMSTDIIDLYCDGVSKWILEKELLEMTIVPHDKSLNDITENPSLDKISGYITYERDGRGNKIANSNEYTEDAINGASINLTIDSNVQLFIENATKKAQTNSKAEWVLMAVMNAKTGEILGYSSSPSFDPNIRNLTNYMDPLISYAYEPGSTMKTFSYMCAIDSGRYDGNATFMSGSKTYVSELDEKDIVTIRDWNGKGWGQISYDYGYAMSSNMGVATLLDEVITWSFVVEITFTKKVCFNGLSSSVQFDRTMLNTSDSFCICSFTSFFD